MAYWHRQQPIGPGFARNAPADLAGVRWRRIAALIVDLVVVSALALAIWLVLVIGTLGLALIFLPPLYPVTAFFYNGLTVSGVYRGTWGQRMMDLEVCMYDSGSRPPFLNAAVHGVLFYLSVPVAPILLISLISPNKRCLHDILAGLIVVRRQG
jgi:uncharacterized RDD family membrane protein YckC